MYLPDCSNLETWVLLASFGFILRQHAKRQFLWLLWKVMWCSAYGTLAEQHSANIRSLHSGLPIYQWVMPNFYMNHNFSSTKTVSLQCILFVYIFQERAIKRLDCLSPFEESLWTTKSPKGPKVSKLSSHGIYIPNGCKHFKLFLQLSYGSEENHWKIE